MAITYYKGEDPHGRDMYAYQRGSADPDIVGKAFGMKNVKEISKKDYEAGVLGALEDKQDDGTPKGEPDISDALNSETETPAPETPTSETPAAETKTPVAELEASLRDLSELKAAELRELGKSLVLDFPAVGMKKADMIAAIAEKQKAAAEETEQTAGGDETTEDSQDVTDAEDAEK